MNENYIPEKLSYLAGIIDGEGSIHIEIQSQSIRHNRKTDYYSLRLLVVNTHLPMLEWIKSNFGGNISTHHSKISNRRICYRWTMCSHNAAELLAACEPYMIIKKSHVAVFTKFASTMSHAHVRLSDELLAYRKELYLELKHINKTY